MLLEDIENATDSGLILTEVTHAHTVNEKYQEQLTEALGGRSTSLSKEAISEETVLRIRSVQKATEVQR